MITAPEQGFELREKVGQLQTALLTAHPMMPTLLRTIHMQLKADPEIVTLLSDDEIHIIVEGLKKQTNTELAMSMLSGKGKSLKKLTVDDL